MVKPVLFVLGASALPLARKLKEPLGAEVHTPDCVAGGDVTYAKATAHLGQLFSEGRSIIGLCAAGILIRAVATHLHDKRNEPPVIALAEDGSSAVPLLGGHHGANELARRIATLTGGHAAVTTASEVRFGFALDDPAPGFVLANPNAMKGATATLLNGAALTLDGRLNPFPPRATPPVRTRSPSPSPKSWRKAPGPGSSIIRRLSSWASAASATRRPPN